MNAPATEATVADPQESPSEDKPGRWRPRRWAIGGGVVVLLALLLVVNALLVSAETKPAEVTHPRGQLLDLPGGEQQFIDQGPRSERAILLLHPYVSSVWSWERVAEASDARFRILRADLLGFGGSAKPREGYAIEDQAEYLATALDELGVRQTVVAGNSYGAGVAVALAEREPDLVEGLAIVDMAPNLPDYDHDDPLRELSYQPIIGQFLRRVTPDSTVETKIKEGLFSPKFDPDRAFDDPERIIDDFRAMTYTSFDESAAAYDEYTETPLDQRLDELGTPTLIVFGSEDRTFDVEKSLEGFSDVASAKTIVFEGAGHAPQLEEPEKFTRLLLKFAATRLSDERRSRVVPSARKP